MVRFDLIQLLVSLPIISSFSQRTDSQSCDLETHLCVDKYGEEVIEIDNKFRRFLIYDQNFGEGFNLRRDVYIRMALLARQLGPEWTLVLPKWSLLPHWRRKRSDDSITQWKSYFDVQSLNRFIPVIEFDEFVSHFKREDKTVIDVVLSLEHFDDTFQSTDWSERHDLKACNRTKHFETIGSKVVYLYEKSDQLIYGQLFCLKIEGFLSTLRHIIVDEFSNANFVFISNAEVIVNNEFGSKDYWDVRRSMRFNDNLISIGNQFRKKYLNSDDISDRTVIDSDWMSMRRSHGQAVGGPYLSVHLRRADFAKWRRKDVPDLNCAVKQIEYALRTYVKTKNVFIASDATQEEWSTIELLLAEIGLNWFRFQASESTEQLNDGQIAIVDQWIASHAILFVGTYDSTFSFRIQEEREILGFEPNTTFNALCPKCDQIFQLCKQESQWKIVY